jgi:hypothetical protein
MRKSLAMAALPAFLSLMMTGAASAATIYTYTGPSFDGFKISATLDLASPANIPAGTNVSGSLTSFVSTAPPEDLAGFLLGMNEMVPPPTAVTVGTDALGNITSWDISEELFASYPAVSGENPNDFFCTYSVTTTNAGDHATLTQDHDAGLCPGGPFSANAGTWSPTFTATAAPEPGSLMLLGSGMLGLLGFARRRRA